MPHIALRRSSLFRREWRAADGALISEIDGVGAGVVELGPEHDSRPLRSGDLVVREVAELNVANGGL
jgi:hypothetical protein